MSIHGLRGIIASGRKPGISQFPGFAEYIADETPRHVVTANGGVVSGNIPEWHSDNLTGPTHNTTKWYLDPNFDDGTVGYENNKLRVDVVGGGTKEHIEYSKTPSIKGDFHLKLHYDLINMDQDSQHWVGFDITIGGNHTVFCRCDDSSLGGLDHIPEPIAVL
jgi:hypothetical protein